jgi:hypothetical protein
MAPSSLHETVLWEFVKHINMQLNFIEQGNDQVAADFVGAIRSTGGSKQGYHEPDGSFKHEKSSKLCVVIEVSYLQKRKDLKYLADDYILESDGLTQLVIGIDLEYEEKNGKEAKVITWRPRFFQENGETVLEAAQTEEGIFRAADGSLVNGERIICIGLKEFGNRYDCPGINDVSGEIIISFSQLYNIVQQSEVSSQNMKSETDVDRPRLVKRKRVRSPPEELYASDEKRWKAAEEEVDEQLYNQDDEYVHRGGLAGCHTEQETEAIRRGPYKKAKATEGPVTAGEAS